MLYLERSFGFDYFTRHELNSLSWAGLLYRLIGSSITTLSRESQGCSDENDGAVPTDATISHSMSIIGEGTTFDINDEKIALKACYFDHNATCRTWHQEHVYCRMHDWFSSWSRSARHIRDRAMDSIKGKLRSKDIIDFSSKQRTQNVGSHYSPKDTSDVPSLSNMPEEIVSELMKQLSPLSLWSFRQASPIYFRIFDSKDFNEYKGELGLRERRPCFHVGKLSAGERAEASKQLRRDQTGGVEVPMYCGSCVEVNNRGGGDPRLVSLRKPRFCEACGENHAGVFFPAQDLEAYDAGAGKLNCLGTTGSWHICGHGVTAPVMWHTVARQMASEAGKDTKQFCRHRAHQYIQPKIEPPRSNCVVSANPRLHMSHCYRTAVELSFGWDLALFDIDAKSIPSLVQVRNAILAALDGNLLDNLTCCQHMLQQGRLQKFARDGICRCFIKPDNTNYPGTEYGRKEFRCDCKRMQVLDCETCSGAFAWQLISGRIFLSYRYHWAIRRPTSPPWMALLDDISEQIYTKHNKHLLWCDQPGCANVNRTQWMDLIKEEAYLQCLRFTKGKKDKETRKIEDDYRAMKLRNTGQRGCYKMPPTRNPAGCDVGVEKS